ncbi:uncharacterized protein TRUGW13939_04717 [Talaromyces rugulosus]|uniref:GED domain-containing protein n=1 Tax=Talaromyces rugulosus TaxID=121627 RepID=A0A7H8QUF2_TALRU|nr:uncharacterized protein TRUGW13939_04717 [Talaromyces rugulosus]QKX57599.1 hypothetical protein TRUGW13939_04717 [Talaromyces rugulosus]
MASGESRANDIFNNPNIKSIYRAASRVTGPYAKALVQQSGIVKALSAGNRQLSVLDQACGTGVVAEALHGEFAAAGTTESNWNLKCTDSGQAMLDAMDDLVKEKGWQNVETAKSDILNNGLESDVYDYAFQSFVFMALPDSSAALDETIRIVKPGGTIAINTWRKMGWMEDVNLTTATQFPDLPQVTYNQFGRLMGDGQWDNPTWIENKLREKKLDNIQVNPVEITAAMGTPEEVAESSVFPMKFIMGKLWNDEQREKYSTRFFPAYVDQMINKYGKDGIVSADWEAIIHSYSKLEMTRDKAVMAVSNGEDAPKGNRKNPSNGLESNGIRRRLNQIDKVRARGIGEHIALPQLLPEVIQEVSKLMGVEGPSFAADVLRIEVNGPTDLHLTVVDLPGLISGSDDNQIVESLVDAYLESTRTIILTVVPASSDIETQPIMRKARYFDTEGERTVGIITKPDLINKGTEGRVALLARNQGATQLKLGFFLLKNPTPQELAEGITPETRQQKEVQYFKERIWRDHGLNFDRVGINSLRGFLQSLLERHIEKALPSVRSEISILLDRTQRRLDELGDERPEISDQRLFLSNLGMNFRLLVQSAVDGTYQTSAVAGDFFRHDGEHIHNRLRAEIHIVNERFSNFMRENAIKYTTEWWGKLDKPQSNDYDTSHPRYMTEEAYMEFTKVLEGKNSLGATTIRFLLGSFMNSQVGGKTLIMEPRVQDEVKQIILSILKNNIAAAMEELRKICEDEKFQPLTYNHYFTDNIQKDRLQDVREYIEKARLDDNPCQDQSNLKQKLTGHVAEVDMRKQACKEAQSALNAYYNVARKTFVDNVCRQVIERHIVRRLPSIFDPTVVLKMSDEEVQRIAAEPTDKLERRKELTALVDALQQSLIDLR